VFAIYLDNITSTLYPESTVFSIIRMKLSAERNLSLSGSHLSVEKGCVEVEVEVEVEGERNAQ